MRHLHKLLLVLALSGTPAMAVDHGPFGAGLMLGEPTGFSGKYWLTSETAVDAGLAWSFAKGSNFQIHADFLYHWKNVFVVDKQPIALYAGIGGRVKFAASGIVSVRIPGGMLYELPSAPIDFFLEIAPMLDFAPATGFSLSGGIGARYFF